MNTMFMELKLQRIMILGLLSLALMLGAGFRNKYYSFLKSNYSTCEKNFAIQ